MSAVKSKNQRKKKSQSSKKSSNKLNNNHNNSISKNNNRKQINKQNSGANKSKSEKTNKDVNLKQETQDIKKNDLLKTEKEVKVSAENHSRSEQPLNDKNNKFKKREAKTKKKNDLLNLRGVHKFWTTHILEIIFIFAVELLTKAFLGTLSWDFSLLRIFLSSCILSLVITTITTNMPVKLRRTLLVIFNFLIAFYAWLQLGFMNFLGAFMSLGNAEQGTKITSYIVEFLCSYNPILHLVYLPFIGTIIYLIFERRLTKDGFAKKIPFKSLLHDGALLIYLCLLIFGFMVTVEVKFMQNKFQTVSNARLLRYPSSPALAIKNFGTTVYVMLDIKSTIFGGEDSVDYDNSAVGNNEEVPEDLSRDIDDTAWKELISKETDKSLNSLNNYFINRPITPKNDYTGKFEGKNLIMIMMESISEAVFHEEYKEYFPTLYKLYTEGITGVNNYSPKNNCATGESEMTSQLGLYSMGTTCTVNTYKNNEYKEALLYTLRRQGYYTSAYHDYSEQYYSRSTFEYKFGAYRYYGVDDLNVPWEWEYKEWPSDYTFVQNALPKITSKDKFAAYMITVSAHTPYIYSSKMGDKHLSLFKDSGFPTTVKRYLSKVKELDLALEYLINNLSEQGKLDDTVIVLFGDHYPYGLSEKDYKKLCPYDVSTNQEVDRTPFIIYNSATEPEKILKYTTPVDYAPTILNLLGADYDPRHYMGHDIFSEYKDYAVFPDNSWQSSEGFYSTSKGEFIPSSESVNMSDEDIIKINNEINNMRSMSTQVYKKNYFKYLFNYFDEYERAHQVLVGPEESGESSNSEEKTNAEG